MAADGFRLDGKVALVTGAAQGIGRSIAIALADAGATVVASDVAAKSSALDGVCDEISAAGGNASACELDVTATSEIADVFDGIVAAYGSLDILVNNAGILVRKPTLEITEEDWDRVLDVNLRGVFFCAQAAAKHMIAQGGGRIINIASQRALSASPGNAPYITSKAAVAGMTRALALDWISSGVTVNAIGPGPVDTPLIANVAPELEQDIIQRSPAGRRMQPEEVAGAAVFLASPAAAAVNGHLLLVDAGWTVS